MSERASEPSMSSFMAGQAVRTRLHAAAGHTRLPIYARGRLGTVHALRGHFPLADEVARHGSADPEALYSVCFHAVDLWGDEAGDHDVYLDLYESYLRPVNPVDLVRPVRAASEEVSE